MTSERQGELWEVGQAEGAFKGAPDSTGAGGGDSTVASGGGTKGHLPNLLCRDAAPPGHAVQCGMQLVARNEAVVLQGGAGEAAEAGRQSSGQPSVRARVEQGSRRA